MRDMRITSRTGTTSDHRIFFCNFSALYILILRVFIDSACYVPKFIEFYTETAYDVIFSNSRLPSAPSGELLCISHVCTVIDTVGRVIC